MRLRALPRLVGLLAAALGLSSLVSPHLPSWADEAPRGTARAAAGHRRPKDPAEAERQEQARRYEAFQKQRILDFQAEVKAQGRDSAKERKEKERVYRAFQQERIRAFAAEAKAQPRPTARELKEQERLHREQRRLKGSEGGAAAD